MIISDTHRVAFLHIPKCAGNSVRQVVQDLDETGGMYTSRTAEHPKLGWIDYAHIPLFVLKDHFPDEYRKLRTYSTYALVRDPYDRFPSSVAQHLGRFGPGPLRTLTPSQIARELDRILTVLERTLESRRYLPVQYIHFQRQTDFVFDRGERVVRHLFGVEELDRLLVALSQKVGRPLGSPGACDVIRSNQTLVYRNQLGGIVSRRVEPLGRKLLPGSLVRRLEYRIRRRILVPWQRRPISAFHTPRVRSFVERYYADDIELHRTVVQGKPTH